MKLDHKNNFDLVRIFAATQVMVGHSGMHVPDWVSYLIQQFPGVPIFFVISGFLITWSYLGGSGGAKAYFVRRFLRIYPALWVNVGLIILLLFVTRSILPDLGLGKFVLWLGATLVSGADLYGNFIVGHIVRPDGFYPVFPSGVLWTIPVELGFYILVPLIVFTFGRKGKFAGAALLGWFAASFAIFVYYHDLKSLGLMETFMAKALSVNTLTYLWLFLIGVGSAVYWNNIRRIFEGRFLLWLALYLGAGLIEYKLFAANPVDLGIGSAFSLPFTVTTLAVAFLLASTVISFAFTWRSLARLLRGNDLSYGVYLYHMPIAFTLAGLGLHGGQFHVLMFTCTLLAAALSWYFIERPALRLKSRAPRWLKHSVAEA